MVKVWFNGRWCILHDPSMTRNEIFGVYDHKEMEKLAGINGSRNKAAAKSLLEDFEAYGATNHAIYSFLYANQVVGSSCKPTSKVKSDKMFQVLFVFFQFCIPLQIFFCRKQKNFWAHLSGQHIGIVSFPLVLLFLCIHKPCRNNTYTHTHTHHTAKKVE